MNEKLMPLLAVLVATVAFTLFSVCVIVSKRHPFFVKKKLFYGALLLNLSGASVGCVPVVSCYDPVEDNYITVSEQFVHSDTIVVNSGETTIIKGSINLVRGTEFSYSVTQSDTMVTVGQINADDGSFDQQNESFSITLPSELIPGSYTLNFYALGQTAITNKSWANRSYNLTVKTQS